ncbi:MAG: PAS domain S-box protein [Anaerolineae bacterium]|nr:PAS domain S-box protein [Anaerolineae bacterium]
MNTLSVSPLIMAGVTFFVGSSHLLIYLRQKGERQHLTFALTCLTVGLYDLFAAGLYNTTSAAQGVQWQRAQVSTLALVSIAFSWFVYDYLRATTAVPPYTRTVLIALSLYFALAAVTGMLDRSGLYRPLDLPDVKEMRFFGQEIIYYEMAPGPLTNLQSVMGLAGFAFLLVITVLVYRRGYRQETRMLILSMGFFFASAVNDTAVASGLYPFVYTMEYAYLAIVLLMTYSLTSAVVDAAATRLALQESEERFRRLAENAPDVIYRWSVDKGLEYVSPIVASITGYSPEELLSNPMLALQIATGNVAQVFDDYQRAITAGAGIPVLQFPYARKDGTCAYADVRSVVIRDDDGRLIAFEGIMRDITERKNAEQALCESEERFRSLFENAVMGVYRTTPDGRWLMANPALLRMLGYSSFDELVGRTAVSEATVTTYPRAIFTERIEREGRVIGFEAAWPRADGSPMFVRENTTAVRGPAGNTLYYEGTVEDITERKKAEAEREELLADVMHRGTQLVTAAEVSASASRILDPEHLMRHAVDLIQQRFNLYYVGLFLLDEDREQAVLRAGTGEAGQNMLVARYRLAVGGESMIGQCVAHAQPVIALDVKDHIVRFNNPLLPETRSEMALPLSSRAECIGALTVQSVQKAAFSAGDIIALQSIANQLAVAITNARLYDQVQQYATRLEERVAERTATLAAVNKELEAFAYSVSHDLRAPLRTLDGFSEALLEDYAGELDATARDYLQRMRAGTHRMGQLIDDLLKLSRLTQGEMQWRRVDLGALAQEIAAELHRARPERQVEFVIAEGVVAGGDAHLLRVVLENLLGNAWKFTGRQAWARIEFGCTKGEGTCIYFVRDNGAGFDMDYADRLFTAFHRLHRLTEFDGTGIGLATVQRIIHRHRGRVWAEGAVNQGATFYFTLGTEAEEAAFPSFGESFRDERARSMG